MNGSLSKTDRPELGTLNGAIVPCARRGESHIDPKDVSKTLYCSDGGSVDAVQSGCNARAMFLDVA